MSDTNNDQTTNNTPDTKEKRKIAPTPVELTRDQERQLHQDRFKSYYIDDSVKHDPLRSSSTEVSPKTVPKKKSRKRPAPDSAADEMSTPAKKMKSSDKAAASSSKPVITPSRVSQRNIDRKLNQRKRSADDDAQEQESPLAKKSKTDHEKTSLSVKGKGKAPAKDATPTPPPSSRTRAPGASGQLRSAGKLPKKHTPSAQLVAKKTEKPQVVDDEQSAADEAVDHTTEHDDDVDEGDSSGKDGIAPDNFKGVSSSKGTSAAKPQDAIMSEPWHCANRRCTTGMTWYQRDGTKGLGRKAISQFFGRNKKETNLIDIEVWHIYCRKDYQTGTYGARKVDKETNSNQGMFNWHMMNLRTQFNRLQLWRPQAKFEVRLTKNMHLRSAEWHKCCRNHERDRAAAQAEYDRHPKWGVKDRRANKKGTARPLTDEEAFPIEMVDNFDNSYCTKDCDYERVTEILDYIQQLFDAGTLTHMPPIEFLINEAREDEEIMDPKDNYERWVAKCDGYEFESADEDDEEQGAADEDGDEEAAEEDEDEDAADDEESEDEEEVEDVVDSIETVFVPLNAQPKKKSFKLTPTDPKNPRPLSSTYGAKEGNGKRKTTTSDSDTIQVKHRP